jgi:hypothetical protein
MVRMKQRMTRSLLATVAVSAVMAYGAAAHAGAIAVSVLEVNGFKIVDATTGTQLTIDIDGVTSGQIRIVSGSNSADASATLGAVTSLDSGNSPVATGGGAIDLTQQCVGACPPFAENSYSGVGFSSPPGSNYSLSDMVLTGSALDTTAIGGSSAGTSAKTRADVSLLFTGDGSATTNTGADVNFGFVPTADLSVRFDLSFVRQVLAHLGGLGDPALSNAQASTSWSLTLEDLTAGTLFSFEPGALNLPDGSRSVFGQADFVSDTSGSLSSSATTLVAGNNYQLTIRHTVEADATFVPEPMALAIFGGSLVMLGFAHRRRRTTPM